MRKSVMKTAANTATMARKRRFGFTASIRRPLKQLVKPPDVMPKKPVHIDAPGETRFCRHRMEGRVGLRKIAPTNMIEDEIERSIGKVFPVGLDPSAIVV